MSNTTEELAELKKRKKQLAKEVKQLESRPGSCGLDISYAKRQKLLVKQKIIQLEVKKQKSMAAE